MDIRPIAMSKPKLKGFHPSLEDDGFKAKSFNSCLTDTFGCFLLKMTYASNPMKNPRMILTMIETNAPMFV